MFENIIEIAIDAGMEKMLTGYLGPVAVLG